MYAFSLTAGQNGINTNSTFRLQRSVATRDYEKVHKVALNGDKKKSALTLVLHGGWLRVGGVALRGAMVVSLGR